MRDVWCKKEEVEGEISKKGWERERKNMKKRSLVKTTTEKNKSQEVKHRSGGQNQRSKWWRSWNKMKVEMKKKGQWKKNWNGDEKVKGNFHERILLKHKSFEN